MENVVILLIGLVATGYIGKIIWKELHGETQCNCAGGCGANCHKHAK